MFRRKRLTTRRRFLQIDEHETFRKRNHQRTRVVWLLLFVERNVLLINDRFFDVLFGDRDNFEWFSCCGEICRRFFDFFIQPLSSSERFRTRFVLSFIWFFSLELLIIIERFIISSNSNETSKRHQINNVIFLIK